MNDIHFGPPWGELIKYLNLIYSTDNRDRFERKDVGVTTFFRGGEGRGGWYRSS